MSDQYALGIHTTTGQLGLAISLNSQIIRSQVWQLERELLNLLHPYLQDFIQPQTWQELSYIAVAKGPGSFTSTRLGMVTARTFGQQLNIPVFTLSSLAIYAWSLRNSYEPNCYIPLEMKATRDKIYGAIYQLNDNKSRLICKQEDTIISPEEWQTLLNSLNLHSSLIKTPQYLGETVTSLLDLAEQEYQAGERPLWQDALPFYGHSCV